MRSKTSCFNKAIFWKSVTRFWPIWGFYLAVWLLVLPISTVAEQSRSALANADHVLSLAKVLGPFGAFSVSIVSAMAVWSFLYNARAAHGTACLPVRREGLFFSNVLAGLLPLLAANMLVALCTALAQLRVGCFTAGPIWQWLGAVTLQLLCFYGIATFCAMLTGNIIILPIVYVVLNLLCIGVELVLRELLRGFVYGMTAATSNVGIYGCPLVLLMRRVRVVSHSAQGSDGVWHTVAYSLQGWRYLIVYAVIGVLLLAAALLLLRRRRMESAGDVVAVPVLKPVFRWCMALGLALVVGLLTYGMFFQMSDYYEMEQGAGMVVVIGLLLGAFLGWFIAEMMLKKSFRVFGEKGLRGWGGFGICAGVILVLALCIRFDVFGVERWTPDPAKVDTAVVSCRGVVVSYTEPSDVAEAVALHKSVVSHKVQHRKGLWYTDEGDGGFGYWVEYHLHGGRVVKRYYQISYHANDPESMTDALLAQELLNLPSAIAARKETAIPLNAQTVTGGGVTAAIPLAQAAELSGYDSPERYLLEVQGGYSAAEVDAMSPEARQEALEDTFRLNVGKTITNVYGAEYSADGDIEIVLPDEMDSFAVYDSLEDLGEADLSRCYVNHRWSFTAAELLELYQTCILPDFADGTLGRMWIILDDQYRDSVYDAHIYIDLRQAQPVTGAPAAAVSEVPAPTAMYDDGYAYSNFHTVPTVAAQRTTQWLLDHGIPLRTLAQIAKGE